jgi:hypothetical protein
MLSRLPEVGGGGSHPRAPVTLRRGWAPVETEGQAEVRWDLSGLVLSESGIFSAPSAPLRGDFSLLGLLR